MKVLKNQKIWVCWKYVSVDGHRTKKPYAVTGIPTGTSQDHADEWSEYSTARKALADAKLGFDGIGFVMPEGVFLLDIDHKDISDPLVQELLALFPSYLPKNNDPFTVKKVYTAYCRWYDACYGKSYRKTKKEFFKAIADSLGTTYEEMVMQNAKGTILRDYAPDADAWEEYGLSDEIFGEVRKWAA